MKVWAYKTETKEDDFTIQQETCIAQTWDVSIKYEILPLSIELDFLPYELSAEIEFFFQLSEAQYCFYCGESEVLKSILKALVSQGPQ